MVNNQLVTFFIYIVSGIIIGLFFDVFRILRKSIKTSNTFTYIEDFIFWVIVGIFLIWEIFNISYGELRSYIFIGLIIGIIFYMFSFSKYFIKINVKILDFIKKPIYFICINISKIIKKIYLKITIKFFNIKKSYKSTKKEGI